MAMGNVDGIATYRQTHNPSRLVWQPFGAQLAFIAWTEWILKMAQPWWRTAL